MKNSISNKSDLEKFYNPTEGEGDRDTIAEAKFKVLNGETPVGRWIKGNFEGMQVRGFVSKVEGYGLVDVQWVRCKEELLKTGTVVGLFGDVFDFYSTEIDLKREDVNELIDMALDMKDFRWAKELVNVNYN